MAKDLKGMHGGLPAHGMYGGLSNPLLANQMAYYGGGGLGGAYGGLGGYPYGHGRGKEQLHANIVVNGRNGHHVGHHGLLGGYGGYGGYGGMGSHGHRHHKTTADIMLTKEGSCLGHGCSLGAKDLGLGNLLTGESPKPKKSEKKKSTEGAKEEKPAADKPTAKAKPEVSEKTKAPEAATDEKKKQADHEKEKVKKAKI